MGQISIPALTGQTIKRVRRMTKKEAERQGWTLGMDGPPIVIELSSGLLLFPSQDPESNGPGCLFGEFKGDGFYIAPEKQA